MLSIYRIAATLLPLAALCSAADNVWEPGTVVSVEEVNVPAKTPDATCRSVPKGATPPEHCRASYLRAQQFWRVTLDVGNKRYVVRPYKAPKFVDTLSDPGPVYVNPNVTAQSSVEVAVLSGKTIRLRTGQGAGTVAMVDSQQLIAKSELPVKTDAPAAASPPQAPRPKAVASATLVAPLRPAAVTNGARVVLLENSDFHDLEVQEFKSQDIGDGAFLYTFSADASPVVVGSNPPVFLVLAEREGAIGAVELSRLQIAKGSRQMAYSAYKSRSASSVSINIADASATVRKITMKDPLPAGEYVLLLENSNHGFLFAVH